jgi:uncharacterized protein
MPRSAVLALAGLLAAPSLTLAAVPAVPGKQVPYLAGHINDTAGLLSPEARQRLEEKLAALEKQTGGAQIAVLTIPSLEGEPLEDYSLRVAETWKLGQKGKDNGALMLVSKGDRKMRIEVGYGLEPQLTDLQTHVILDEIMRPRFQQGDFEGGIEAGVDAIAGALTGKPVEAPKATDGGESIGELPVGAKAGFSLIFLLVIGLFSLVALTSSGCQSWFLYAILTPFYFGFPSAILGPGAGVGFALGWLIGFPLLKMLLGPRMGGPGGGLRRRGGAWPIILPGGWGGGGWSSRGGGWSGGGGGGFGGFSGGGGSFGGGGASGSW